jgi:hypothetical protein
MRKTFKTDTTKTITNPQFNVLKAHLETRPLVRREPGEEG